MIEPGSAHRARAAAIGRLRVAGVASPEYDAAELLAAVLGTSRGLLPLAPDLDEQQAARYDELVTCRAARLPLQHLLGSAGFYGLEIEVGPGVFTPRPETELLVQHALSSIESVPAPIVVDLCAGSGAIAIAIAHSRPDAVVTAVETSEQAGRWLRRNVERLAPGVRVVIGDVLDESLAVPAPVDLVTCNPPYVPDKTAVDHETARHEPSLAVFAGDDGLALIRPLVPRIAGLLRVGGSTVIEHDDSHQDAVLELFAASGRFRPAAAIADLAGRPRYVSAVRSPSRD